jgi:hypothetical protein
VLNLSPPYDPVHVSGPGGKDAGVLESDAMSQGNVVFFDIQMIQTDITMVLL